MGPDSNQKAAAITRTWYGQEERTTVVCTPSDRPAFPGAGQSSRGIWPNAYFFFFGFLVSFFMSLPLAIADSPSLLLSSSMCVLKGSGVDGGKFYLIRRTP